MRGVQRAASGSPCPDPVAERADPPRPGSFPRRARLLLPDEFQRCLRGARKRGRWLVAASSPSPCTYSRLGIVVGRRAVPSAVVRNRIKRTLREVFRNLAATRNMDVVVRVQSAPSKQDYVALRTEAIELLSRVLC